MYSYCYIINHSNNNEVKAFTKGKPGNYSYNQEH